MYDTIILNKYFTKKLQIRINVYFNNEHKIARKSLQLKHLTYFFKLEYKKGKILVLLYIYLF